MRPPLARLGQALTLLTTYAIKLVGLASAFDQLLLKDHPTPLALGVSAFMMAGAQLSEGLILAMLDRLVGGEAATPEPSKEGQPG